MTDTDELPTIKLQQRPPSGGLFVWRFPNQSAPRTSSLEAVSNIGYQACSFSNSNLASFKVRIRPASQAGAMVYREALRQSRKRVNAAQRLRR